MRVLQAQKLIMRRQKKRGNLCVPGMRRTRGWVVVTCAGRTVSGVEEAKLEPGPTRGAQSCMVLASIWASAYSTAEEVPLRPLASRRPTSPARTPNSSLKFNAVADWWDEYIAYDVLKKCIYQLEKRQHGLDHDLESNERVSLLHDADQSDTDTIFIPLLDRELTKITIFYEAQVKELLDEITELESHVKEREEAGPTDQHYYLDDDEDDDDEEDEEDDIERSTNPHSPDTTRSPKQGRRKSTSAGYASHRNTVGSTSMAEGSPVRHRYSMSSSDDGADLEASITSLRAPKSPMGTMERARQFAHKLNFMGVKDSVSSSNQEASLWTAKTNYAWDMRLLFKRRITNLYVSVSALKSYVDTNYSGFRKILKKYDKVTDSELKDRYMHEVVENALPFTQSSKSNLNDGLTRLLNLYAKCVTRGDISAAKQQLRLHQRENIAWERDTVWRQMIGRERRGESDGQPKAIGATLVDGDEDGLLELRTPVGPFKITMRKIAIAIAVTIFVTLLNVQTIKGVEANRCFAILVFCTVLWATEAIPLFVTSMFVPLLLVWFQVIRSEDGSTQLTTPDATKYVFSIMFSPTIMLLIGGFTISSALSKTNIDRILITKVLSLAGSKPSRVLLAFMAVSCFASMWISNVAAPTLCFTLIRPILRTLPPKSAFGPCLILAIALAANIGGQSSPISSPQNLIALHAMDPPIDWSTWFIVALPVSAISIFLIWLLLLLSYRPGRSPDGESDLEIKTIKPIKEPFTIKQYWVSFVCLTTIGLWCVAHSIQAQVGDMGVIAILPIVAFFSTGVLKKDDFEQFMWTIVFLAMGGIALGKGVTSSGLLEIMDVLIRNFVGGRSLFTVVLLLSPVVLIVSTFISHTIASVLLVPIAKEVGSNLSENHANLLIFITGLICSAGMGMPVSGFPNQTAATQEDELGQLYLTNIDFLKNGVPASIISTVVVATVGFLLMKAVGL